MLDIDFAAMAMIISKKHGVKGAKVTSICGEYEFDIRLGIRGYNIHLPDIGLWIYSDERGYHNCSTLESFNLMKVGDRAYICNSSVSCGRWYISITDNLVTIAGDGIHRNYLIL